MVAVSVDVRHLGGDEEIKEKARERGRTELDVLLLLLCMLLLGLECSEVGEEITELLGSLRGVPGLFEVADTLWMGTVRCVGEGGGGRVGRTRRMSWSLSFGD